MALARLTSEDGQQRALDRDVASLEELMQLRLQVRERLCAQPAGSPLRHVSPWLWRVQSTGQPLTAQGRESGYELRLSRYRQPVC